MRLTPIAAALLFATCAAAQPAPDAGPAPNQAPPPADQAAPPASPHGHAGFDAANTTHDGRLTRDQAQAAGMKPIARHFDEIDADHKGYVTKQDIRTWRQAKKAAKQARMQQGGQAGATPPAGSAPAPDAEQEQPGPAPQ